MPSYDFQCQTCAKKFSVFCTISQKDHQSCQYCGSNQLIQRITSVNIGGKSFSQDNGAKERSSTPRSRYG